MDFEHTAPPARTRTSGGKPAMPNPYAEKIAEIALKTYTKENAPTPDAVGKPVALAFILNHANADAVKTDRNRVKRQTSEAGDKNTPRVTVKTDFVDANTVARDGKSTVTKYATRATFWTVPRQNRARKTADTPKSE